MLLTRSPLGLQEYCYSLDPVRLACVKHAASVRPEPGSNSPSKPRHSAAVLLLRMTTIWFEPIGAVRTLSVFASSFDSCERSPVASFETEPRPHWFLAHLCSVVKEHTSARHTPQERWRCEERLLARVAPSTSGALPLPLHRVRTSRATVGRVDDCTACVQAPSSQKGPIFGANGRLSAVSPRPSARRSACVVRPLDPDRCRRVSVAW